MNELEAKQLDKALRSAAPEPPAAPGNEWAAINAKIATASARPESRWNLFSAPVWAVACGAGALLISFLVQVQQAGQQTVDLTAGPYEYNESVADLLDSPAFAEEEDLPEAWILLAEGQD